MAESIKSYTKKYLTTALFKLMKGKNYNNITISDITKKAGVSRVTYYRNFESKDDIIYQYFISNIEPFNSSITFRPRCKDDYFEIIYHVFEGLKKKKEILDLLISANLEHLLLKFINDSFVDSVRNNHVDNDFIAYGYAGAFFNISIKWIKEQFITPIKEVVNSMYKIVFPDSIIE